MPAAVDREQGWRDALHAAGLSDERVAHADFSEEGGARAAAGLLDRYPDVDAIFVASDLMASGALTTLAERGRTVPGTSPSSATTTAPMPSAVRPRLTTVAQPTKQMGIVMADTLLRLLAGDETPRVTLLETHLVRRDSA